ncbi:MAG: DUF1365 domain-containing protein [Gemmatimonadota bacterium]|nr:DUF1365 domain-containing protein [Gemmatimonadota bacterium]
MTTPGSALYLGTVRHRRFSPVSNRFKYGVYQLLFDLDDLGRLDEQVRGFGYNRASLVSFHDADHLGAGREPVRKKLRKWLETQGQELGDGPVLLLTNPRVLGYVFNPVSYFFCFDGAGAFRFTVAEVNNTFGETFCYLLDDQESIGGRAVRSNREKRFHVSPFMPIEGLRYEWIVTPPGDHLTVHIDEFQGDTKFFDATLNLARRPLTSGTLARALLRYPHLTARTMALIHWQAAKLWLKKTPFFRKPEPPENGLTAA